MEHRRGRRVHCVQKLQIDTAHFTGINPELHTILWLSGKFTFIKRSFVHFQLFIGREWLKSVVLDYHTAVWAIVNFVKFI